MVLELSELRRRRDLVDMGVLLRQLQLPMPRVLLAGLLVWLA